LSLWFLTIGLFEGGDGFGLTVGTDEGTIELYVWSEDTLPSNTTSTLVLNQAVLWYDKETALPGVGNSSITFTRGWVSASLTSNLMGCAISVSFVMFTIVHCIFIHLS